MKTADYSEHLEKRLIESFREQFFSKVGYYPHVITRGNVHYKDYLPPSLTLEDLEDGFYYFLPRMGDTTLHLKSKLRKREIVELRQMFCYMARKVGFSFETIGNFLGKRDHTTVIHSVKTFKNLYQTSEPYRDKYDLIFNHIKKKYDAPIVEHTDPAPTQSQPAVFP